MIGCHYHAVAEKYAARHPEHGESPAVKEIKARMVEAGFLRPVTSDEVEAYGDIDYAPTAGLHQWVEALCNVPWPEQRWVLPKKKVGRRPSLGEPKPWAVEGVSKSTWYRREREKAK
jgi:hypothetical protein